MDQSCQNSETQQIQGLSIMICLLPATPWASLMVLSRSLPAAGVPFPAWFLSLFPQPQCEYSFPKVFSQAFICLADQYLVPEGLIYLHGFIETPLGNDQTNSPPSYLILSSGSKFPSANSFTIVFCQYFKIKMPKSTFFSYENYNASSNFPFLNF